MPGIRKASEKGANINRRKSMQKHTLTCFEMEIKYNNTDKNFLTWEIQLEPKWLEPTWLEP